MWGVALTINMMKTDARVSGYERQITAWLHVQAHHHRLIYAIQHKHD